MFCLYRKSQLCEDSEWLSLALEVFTRAHRLLKNFVDFYKFVPPWKYKYTRSLKNKNLQYRFHSKKCFAINYESIPLHGALDVVTASTASIICVSVLKKKCQQSDLYQDMSPCVRCQDFDILPDEVVRKVSGKKEGNVFERFLLPKKTPPIPPLPFSYRWTWFCCVYKTLTTSRTLYAG